MSTDFEKDIDAYYQSKESYTKLLFDPSARKTSDLDEKKDPSPMKAFENLGPLLQQKTTVPAQTSITKTDFEALFEGESLADVQAATSSTPKNSTVKKTMPILSRR